jgi:N-methylhydantoinase A
MLVPAGAGVGSAIGFLRAPFSFEANRSQFMRLSDFDTPAITTLLNELKVEATSFVRSCDAQAEIQAQYKVYMRYSGQGWEIPVQLTANQAETPDLATFQALFEREYAALFGRVVEAMDVEITVWSVNATTPAQSVTPVDVVSSLPLMTTQIRRALFDPATAAVAQASEVLRSDMTPGTCIAGPAVITEDETTIIVPTSRRATALADGCIDVSDKGADL